MDCKGKYFESITTYQCCFLNVKKLHKYQSVRITLVRCIKFYHFDTIIQDFVSKCNLY